MPESGDPTPTGELPAVARPGGRRRAERAPRRTGPDRTEGRRERAARPDQPETSKNDLAADPVPDEAARTAKRRPGRRSRPATVESDPPQESSPDRRRVSAAETPRSKRITVARIPRRRLTWSAVIAAWFLSGLLGLAAVLVAWLPVTAPEIVPQAGAAALTTVFAFGLAARTGGRALISGALALALGASAVATQHPVLLAGATVVTATVAAVLGVMATKPAARFAGVVREIGVAVSIAAAGAFAVHGYGAEVSVERVGYLALGLSLLGALGLVYRLGAGLHGLGRRGLVMVLGGLALLAITLAYTEALSRWGSPGLIDGIAGVLATVEAWLGAVPRPIEVLVGFPALAWGISTRARRRQGWWVCAFGAAGLAVIATSLLGLSGPLYGAGLELGYSLLLGLGLGYLVIRADLFFTGPRGRRARRLEEASAHRPEPGRLEPLL